MIGQVSASFMYVAQNDSAQFSVINPEGTCWYFPDVEKMELTKLYDLPVGYCDNHYCCSLTARQTANMHEGNYTLIYTYPSVITNVNANASNNYLKDISWKDDSLVSVFGNKEDESGKQGYMVMADLKLLTESSKTDNLEEYQIGIQPPLFTITRQEQVNDHVIDVYGTSNMANGTQIVVKLDESDHMALKDSGKYTFGNAYVHRDSLSQLGYWERQMNISIAELAPGWHTTTAYAGGLITTARFPIYQSWTSAPTPTQYINYFGNGSLKPDIVTVTVTIVQIETKMVDVWHTATVTPPITDALGKNIEYPYKTGNQIPTSIGVVALLCMGAIVLVRGGKK